MNNTIRDSLERVIFNWDKCEVVDTYIQQYLTCDFIKDFGPWSKGYTAFCIVLDIENSLMTEYDTNSEVVAQVELELEVKEIIKD